MGARMTAIEVKEAGRVICTATEGEASDDRNTVKLTKGINWVVAKPLACLQMKIMLSAKIHDAGVPQKSFAKPMYVSGITPGSGVRLTEKKEA